MLYLSKISLLIKNYRFENEISQETFASMCGISRNYLSEIEREIKFPSINVLIKITNILGICPYEILKLCAKCTKINCEKKIF